jgi:Flp pilus assembly protein TadD
MSGVRAGGRRLVRWAAVGLVLLALAALVAGAWRKWGRTADPPPGPSEAVLAAADPEVVAAVRMARERVMREPRSAEAWGLLGEVLLANGFGCDGDTCLGRAEALDPNEPAWPYLRVYDFTHDRATTFAAAGRAVAACERSKRNEAVPFLFLAERCLEQGDYERASGLCRRVLAWEPDNARAHLDLGLIALADDRVEVCILHLFRATNDPTTRLAACTQLAAAYQRSGDRSSAAEYSRRARQLPPDEPASDPYAERVEQLKTGRQTRYRQVKRLEEKGRAREAIVLLRKITADDPSDSHAFVLLGTLLTTAGDQIGGEQAFRKAVALAPGSVVPLQQLAVSLFVQGEQLRAAGDEKSAAEKYRAAVATARQATDIDPDNPQARSILGLGLKRLGRWQEAIESCRLALRFRPDDAELHLALGEALAEDGQKAEALSQLQSASHLAAPNDPRPRQALDRLQGANRPRSWPLPKRPGR